MADASLTFGVAGAPQDRGLPKMWSVPISTAAHALSARKPVAQEKTVQKGWTSAQALASAEQQ